MKQSRSVWILILASGVACFAQESTQKVTRVLPTRLNPTPPPAAPALPPAPPITAPNTPRPITVPASHAQPPPAQVVQPPPVLPDHILAWDSEVKEFNAKQGDAEARFTFYFTNVSKSEVVINSASASCGCTVPKMPQLPWTNAPGATGEIPVTMNLAGKSGIVFKTVTVNTDKGPKTLTVKVAFEQPPPPVAMTPELRVKNQDLAKADRQAVFKGDCASGHVAPTRGKVGKELYAAACGICHDAEHRATMVPDLHALKHDTNADYWKTWISQGKPRSLMPAFASSEGGPLTDTQILTLVHYLSTTIPQHAVHTASAGN